MKFLTSENLSSFLHSSQKGALLRRGIVGAPKRLKATSPEQPFLFTEVVRCGKIGKIALESFRLHHPETIVHIYGTKNDFSHIPSNPYFIFHDIGNEVEILNNFNSGHLGTASLWAKIILERPERYILHFDSDVIFRGSVFPEMIRKLKEGFALIGPIRNYQHNPAGRNDVRYLADISQTMCFGFDREFITSRNYATLTAMCQGTKNPFGLPIIDFFDPIMFDILKNGGRTYFLPQDAFGGCNTYGSRAGKYTDLNTLVDFGDALAHFSAVGSGMYYYEHKGEISSTVARTYMDYALEKYAVYCKIFLNENIDVPFDTQKYQAILQVQDWYNQKNTREPLRLP